MLGVYVFILKWKSSSRRRKCVDIIAAIAWAFDRAPQCPPAMSFLYWSAEQLSEVGFIITSLPIRKRKLREVLYLRSHYLQVTAGIWTQMCLLLTHGVLVRWWAREYEARSLDLFPGVPIASLCVVRLLLVPWFPYLPAYWQLAVDYFWTLYNAAPVEVNSGPLFEKTGVKIKGTFQQPFSHSSHGRGSPLKSTSERHLPTWEPFDVTFVFGLHLILVHSDQRGRVDPPSKTKHLVPTGKRSSQAPLPKSKLLSKERLFLLNILWRWFILLDYKRHQRNAMCFSSEKLFAC